MHNKKMATTWSKSTCTGSLPKPRCSHASCIVDGKLLISGGWTSGSRFLNDIHIYHIDSSTWSQPVTSGDFNTPRVGHTMTPVENRVFVFGGSDGYRAFNDLQIFDLETMKWSTAIVKGNLPESRSRHTATRIGMDIYVFGGGDNIHLYNDLYVLNTESLEWTLVKTRGMSPSCRWGHTTTLVDHKLYVFGGHDGQRRLNDVHVLNLETLTWTQPGMRKKKKKLLALPNSANSNGASTTSSSSSSSSSHTSSSPPTSAPATPIKIFDGGIPPAPPLPRPKSHDVAPVESQPLLSLSGTISAGSSPETPNSMSSSSSSSDSSGNVSCPVTPPTSPASATAAPPEGPVTPVQPPPRAGHTAALYGRKIIVYGGGDGKLLGDMYYLNVDTLQWFSMESGNVPDRCAHTCDVFEAIDASGTSNTKLLVFGGSNGIKTFNDLYTVAIGKHKLRRSSNSTPVSSSIINGKKADFAALAPSQEAQTAMAPTGIPPPPPIPASTTLASVSTEPRSNSLTTRRFGGVTQKANQIAAAAAAAAAAASNATSSTSTLASSTELSSSMSQSAPAPAPPTPGTRPGRRSLHLSREQIPISQSPGQSSPVSSSPVSSQPANNGSSSTPASPRTSPTIPAIPAASLAAAAATSAPFTPSSSVNNSSTVRVLNRDRRNSGKDKDLTLPPNYPSQNGSLPAPTLAPRSNPPSPRMNAPAGPQVRPTTPPHQPQPQMAPISVEPISMAQSSEISMLVQLQMQTQQLLQHSIMQQQQLQHRIQEQITLQQQQQTAQLQILQHLMSSMDRIRSGPSTPLVSPRAPGHSSSTSHNNSSYSSSESQESKMKAFLDRAGLSKYRQVFAQHDITYDQIPLITDKDLQQLGLTFIRDRVLFSKARNETFGPARSQYPPAADLLSLGDQSYMGGMPHHYHQHPMYPPPYGNPYLAPPSPELLQTLTKSLETLHAITSSLKQTHDNPRGHGGASDHSTMSSSSSSSSSQ